MKPADQKTAERQFLQEEFIKHYGGDPANVRLFFAPGRINLIGEHTDYNGGYVFPAALTLGTWLMIRKRPDRRIRFASVNIPETVECAADDLQYRAEDDWANYPKGVIAELQQLGIEPFGADLLYYGNIPNGAGLSSSASIELVTALAISTLAGVSLDPVDLVKISQRAENHFVGVNCGIMDQFAVGMGKQDHAILLQCATLDYELVPLRLAGYQLVITNTNKRRGLTDSKYNERRAECEQGLAALQKVLPAISHLADVTPEMLEMYEHVIPQHHVKKRVRHVVEENARVKQAVGALQAGDLRKFGELMIASHDSLRDLYEVTGVELDTLYEVAKQVQGCIGTRMTGAGFGGCTVSLVESGQVEAFQIDVAKRYTEKTGLAPSFYLCGIGDGVKEME
ncbi:galactokinase [Fodinisporobacter ferrooxydans]|uniref:Galactokinase n=1 Tax=Fodinisporobacter ferrooxydans TaxID=2901836 RepID=A0ABY4CM15_9BACL|nr:galactokinase [Alicyclobacillaceae bacterium MYW30-H2]